MMMASNSRLIHPSIAAVLPPEVYFRGAMRLLKVARRLFGARLLGRPGMILALRWANILSCTGRVSWHTRNRRLGV